MKIEVHNMLHKKANTKKDGIYSYQGFLYVVENGGFKAYSDYEGNINSVHGVLHYHTGKVERCDRKSKLKELYLTKK